MCERRRESERAGFRSGKGDEKREEGRRKERGLDLRVSG